MPGGCWLQINVTYDASAAGAPAGFAQAVNAAVQFFDSTISNNITVNIAFGWGEVGGQSLDAGALGESNTNFLTGVSYSQLLSSLAIADAGSPGASGAVQGLPSTPPYYDSDFWIATAEAQALGLAGSSGVDGEVGLSSSAAFTFDPNNRAVAGEYDAIGILEHEISEVLGRQLFESSFSSSGQDTTVLDLFRYASANSHAYYNGLGYFSLNGDQLLHQFNDGLSNGGDDGDWATSGTPDSFDAFAQTGVTEAVSTVDLRVLELLGYHISNTAPTPNGAGAAPFVVSQNGGLGSGQSMVFAGPAAILFSSVSASAGPSYSNAGTITDSGTQSQVDVVGVRYDPNALVALTPTTNSTFTNTASGVLSVNAVAVASDAAGVFFGVNQVVNSGQILVNSATADAWGVVGSVYTSTASGVLTVQAADHAVGVEYGPAVGGALNNAGAITVNGVNTAYGLDLTSTGALSVTNSGALAATASAATGVADGILLSLAGPGVVSIVNTGSISATGYVYIDYYGYPVRGSNAINVGLTTGSLSTGSVAIDNSGVIQGNINLSTLTGGGDQIVNTGTISGDVLLGAGGDIYNSSAGSQVTMVLGGQGNDTISGAGGSSGVETLGGGGGVNTLTYANANAGVTASLVLGQAQMTGGGGTELLSGFQNLIGSAFNDTLEGATGSKFLDGGGGVNTLTYADLGYIDPWAGVSYFTGPTTYGVNVSLALQGAPQNIGYLGNVTLNNFQNLIGTPNNDTLEGDGGNNVLNGGGGINTVSYAHAASGVTVSLSLQGSPQNTIGAGTDTLTNFQNLTGSAFNDILEGDGGNNVLDGGGGINTVSYAHAASGVTVNLALQGSAQNTIGAGIDTLANFQNIIGSPFADHLTGDANNNVINGGGGDDVLDGGGGVNTLTFVSATQGVTVSLALQGTPQNTGVGTDTLTNFQNLIGSAFADTLTGDANNNVIDGGGGNDVLDGGGGINTVSFASATQGVTVSLALQGTAQTTGVGTDTLTNFQNLTGSAFADHLTGDANNNVISGGGGDDVLTGGGGADTFVFAPGAGNSVITDFSAAQDTIDLSAFGNFQSMADVMGAASTSGSNTVIRFAGGGSVTLDGVLKSSLTAADFGLPASTPPVNFDLSNLYSGGADTAVRNNAAGGWGETASAGSVTQTWQGMGYISTAYSVIGTGDFNGDGVTDVAVLDQATGAWGYLAPSRSGALGWQGMGYISLAYSVIGVGDFNGDGLADVAVLDSATGAWGYLAPSRSGALAWHDMGYVSLAYSVIGTGDFNGDGVTDIAFLDHATGAWGYLAPSRSGALAWHDMGYVSLAYSVAGIADLNGDGVSDIAFIDHATGDWGYLALTASGGESWHDAGVATSSFSILGNGDFNGAGGSDVAFLNTADGQWGYATTLTGGNMVSLGRGDFSGDGVQDVAMRDSSTGAWGYMEPSANGASTWHPMGGTSLAYAAVGTGDFNGDGISDIAFINAANGDLGYLAPSRSGALSWHDMGFTSTAYTAAGVGNFNGDSLADVAFINHATGDWGYLSTSLSGAVNWHDMGYTSLAFSAIGVGDFDGKGAEDLLFRNASTGELGYLGVPASGGETWHSLGFSSTDFTVIGIGDFNSDGLTDIAFRDTGTGEWYLALTTPAGGETWRDMGHSAPGLWVV